MVEQRFCKPLAVCSNQIGGLSSIKLQMSLISQRDRQLAIDALTCYARVKDTLEWSEQDRMELNALINWIKLEYFKNEN